MLKKISFFALAALIFVGCSSDKEEKKEPRSFKDSVYAFVNTQPNIVGYGRADVRTIMDESNIEKVGVFDLFVAETYREIKTQVDANSPVYFATTTTEGHTDLTVYAMFKLKNKKKFVTDWTNMGYEFKEHNGITYAEDEGYVLSAKDNTLMVIAAPGDFDGKKLVSQAYKSTEGKIAPDWMKKQLETKGDFVMHMNMDELRANDRNLALLPSGIELDFTLNFAKGMMEFEAVMNDFDKLKSQLNMEMTDEPIITKKVTDEQGNIVLAMQLSAKSQLMDMVGMNADELSRRINSVPMMLDDVEATLTVSNMNDTDQVTMPSGKKMGGQYMEMLINLDALMGTMPKFEEQKEYWSKLDYATLSVTKEGKLKATIKTDEEGQNFLATIFMSVDDFLNNGGLAMLMTM
ncbi:MAG: hypothetical protein NXI10_10940 [bacterium]|nr:hypothetical protein [bacterium]